MRKPAFCLLVFFLLTSVCLCPLSAWAQESPAVRARMNAEGHFNPRAANDPIPYQPDEVPPVGTPPCGTRDEMCWMGVSPNSGPIFRPIPLPAAFRAESRWLQTHPLVQDGGPNDTARHAMAFQRNHPEVWIPPPPIVQGNPVKLCAGCTNPDGSVWAHQPPLMLPSGQLAPRTSVLYGEVQHHPLSWYLSRTLFLAVLLLPGVYYGTKLLQTRRDRAHARRVAARTARAFDRARRQSPAPE